MGGRERVENQREDEQDQKKWEMIRETKENYQPEGGGSLGLTRLRLGSFGDLIAVLAQAQTVFLPVPEAPGAAKASRLGGQACPKVQRLGSGGSERLAGLLWLHRKGRGRCQGVFAGGSGVHCASFQLN